MSRASENDEFKPPQESRTDEFLRLYATCESRLFAYLMSLLGNHNDAQDVSQETLLALWRCFDEFQPGTSFYAWARRIAYHRVLTYRKQRRRQGVPCSESFLAAIAQTCDLQSDRLERCLRYLDECMARLPQSDRDLLQVKFQSAVTAKNAAERLGRPANTVYKALARIYRSLADCVTRAMSREERP